jgi:hypothetical protein
LLCLRKKGMLLTRRVTKGRKGNGKA